MIFITRRINKIRSKGKVMKNSWDYCLLSLVVFIGLGLAGFNAVWSWADCPNQKEAYGICTSCSELYFPCNPGLVDPSNPLSGLICTGGGLQVNSNGAFGVTGATGSRATNAGSEWCTIIHSCIKTPPSNELVEICTSSEFETSSSVYASEPCGE